MVNIREEILKGGQEIEDFLGLHYGPKSVADTAKLHGLDLTVLPPSKTTLLKDLAEADYDLIVAKKEYKTAQSALGPASLAVLGLILTIFFVGILILIAALIWYLIRVNSRSHLYQKIKDLEDRRIELKKKIESVDK